MANPITTHNTTTTTTTTTQKPSTMDNIKDKATNLLDKVTGKSHTYTDHQGVVRQPDNALGHNNTAGLNQPGVHTTSPSGATGLDNTAGLNNPTNPNILPAGANTATATNPAHHGIVHSNVHQQHTSGLSHSGPTHTGAAMAGAAVPHDPSVDRAAYQQQNPNVAPVQHAVPAGPTGISNIPTYAQNIPPTAAGVVPSTQVAEVHDGRDTKPSLFGGHKKDHHDHGLGAHQQVHSTAAGGNVPMDTTTSPSAMHPNAGVQNTVPAMGAPGTTTAAGTHVPGEYNPSVAQPGVALGNVAYDPYHRPVA